MKGQVLRYCILVTINSGEHLGDRARCKKKGITEDSRQCPNKLEKPRGKSGGLRKLKSKFSPYIRVKRLTCRGRWKKREITIIERIQKSFEFCFSFAPFSSSLILCSVHLGSNSPNTSSSPCSTMPPKSKSIKRESNDASSHAPIPDVATFYEMLQTMQQVEGKCCVW